MENFLSCFDRFTPEQFRIASEVESNIKKRNDEWIEKLRENGIKAAHPDDGMVNREDNSIRFDHPFFDDGFKIGDIITLGWPDSKSRNVVITGKKYDGYASNKWFFEEVK